MTRPSHPWSGLGTPNERAAIRALPAVVRGCPYNFGAPRRIRSCYEPSGPWIELECRLIRWAARCNGRPKVPTGCTLTLHRPHRTEPHIYRTPETTR